MHVFPTGSKKIRFLPGIYCIVSVMISAKVSPLTLYTTSSATNPWTIRVRGPVKSTVIIFCVGRTRPEPMTSRKSLSVASGTCVRVSRISTQHGWKKAGEININGVSKFPNRHHVCVNNPFRLQMCWGNKHQQQASSCHRVCKSKPPCPHVRGYQTRLQFLSIL